MDNNNKTAITSTFVSSITTIKCLVLVFYLFSSLFFTLHKQLLPRLVACP